MHRHYPVGLIAAGLALVLASCAAGDRVAEVQAWAGTSTTGDATYPLAIDTTLAPSGAWAGTYTVQRTPPFTGEVEGTLVNGVVDGVLIVSSACRFELAGTVSDAALDATFTPSDCPGATGGTWTVTRSAATPDEDADGGATTGGATFDSDATFDNARFR